MGFKLIVIDFNNFIKIFFINLFFKQSLYFLYIIYKNDICSLI